MQLSHWLYLLGWQQTNCEYHSKHLMGCFAEVTLMKFWRCFNWQSFYFFINLINDTGIPFHDYWFIYAMFAAPCINTITEPLNYSRLCFSSWILVVSLYLQPLGNNFLNLWFLMICESPVTICWWSFSI